MKMAIASIIGCPEYSNDNTTSDVRKVVCVFFSVKHYGFKPVYMKMNTITEYNYLFIIKNEMQIGYVFSS